MDTYNKISKTLGKVESDLSKDFLSAGYLVGIFLGLVGLVLIILESMIFYKIHKINSWPIIKNGGIISDSYLESTYDTTTYSIFFASETFTSLFYRNRVSFVYKIGNDEYISNQLSYIETWDQNPMTAKIENDKYKPGSRVDIRVNPNNSAEAYIVNKPYINYLKSGLGVCLLLIGVYSFIKSK